MAGGHHAIEHIDTPLYCLNNITGGADAHQITGLCRRQLALQTVENADHILLGLTHRQAANGVAVKADLPKGTGGLTAQVLVHTALNDPKQGRRAVAVGLFAARGPTHGQLHGIASLFFIRRIGRAFVKHHHHIGAQLPLYLDGTLRVQEHRAAIDG